MSNEWDEYAEGWDVDASVQEYAKRAFEQLLKVVELDGLSVFDFGCGTGQLSQLMSPSVKEIVALDGSPEMIKRLDQKGLSNVSTIADYLTQELIDRNPQLSGGFDLIVASSVCGFVPDYEATVGLLKSLLRDGGVFVQWDWLSKDSEEGMSETRVRSALESQGFVDVQISTPFEMTSSKGSMTVLMATGKAA